TAAALLPVSGSVHWSEVTIAWLSTGPDGAAASTSKSTWNVATCPAVIWPTSMAQVTALPACAQAQSVAPRKRSDDSDSTAGSEKVTSASPTSCGPSLATVTVKRTTAPASTGSGVDTTATDRSA